MKSLLTIIIAALLMVACSKKESFPEATTVEGVPVANSSAPAAPAAQPPSGIGNMLTAGLMGYMLGSSGSRSAAPAAAPPTVIHQTIVKKVFVSEKSPPPAAPVAAPPAQTRPPTPTPSFAPKTPPGAPVSASYSYKPSSSTSYSTSSFRSSGGKR